jgi:hypothetical protein
LHFLNLRFGVLAVALTAYVAFGTSGAEVRADQSVAQAAKEFSPTDPRFSALTPLQREELAESILGSTLFTVSHELGHAIIGLFELPMLGPEEDAADTFAAIALLSVGSEFTHRAMLDAAISLKRAAEREHRTADEPVFSSSIGRISSAPTQSCALCSGLTPGNLKIWRTRQTFRRSVKKPARTSLNKQMMLESCFEAAYARRVIRSSFAAPPSAGAEVGE